MEAASKIRASDKIQGVKIKRADADTRAKAESEI